MPPTHQAPLELSVGICTHFPAEEWEHAYAVAYEESEWFAFALRDTTTPAAPCGTPIGAIDEVPVVAERSVGYFQINTCNFPEEEWQRYYNANANTEKAAALWLAAGRSWRPWYFAAVKLGLLP
jgi:hypothetical protein